MDAKVPQDQPLPTRTEAEGATVDLPDGVGFFTVGQVLGDRFEILRCSAAAEWARFCALSK